MLTSLVTVLIFGSYTRQTTLQGVISGAREEVVVTPPSPEALHIGEDLLLDVQATSVAGGPFTARISSVAPSSVSGRSLHQVRLKIPAALRRDVGMRFLLHVPLERRHIYQWMFPCLSN